MGYTFPPFSQSIRFPIFYQYIRFSFKENCHEKNEKGIIHIKLTVVGDLCRGWPEVSLFNSYFTEVLESALLFSLDCSTLSLIPTLYCWVLSKEVSSTIFKSIWYDTTWVLTQVSQTIVEHSNHQVDPSNV